MLSPRKQSGMSLIELLITLAIVGIVLMAGAGSFATWVGNTQIRTVAEAQQAGLRFARNEAMKRNTPVQIQFDADYRGWTITDVPAAAVIKQEAGLATYTQITTTAQPAAASVVVFDGLGRQTPLNNVAPITRLDVDAPNMAANDSRELAILISPAGGIRLCRPDRVAPDPAAC